MAKRPRYEMIMNIPAPYRLPLFRELHKQMAERGVDFTVHFMNRGHKDRPKSWLNPKMDIPHRYWRNWGPDQHELNPGLVLKMIFNPPEWLELGSPYDTFTCILLALFCRAKHVVMGLEGNTKTPGKMDGFVGWFKRLIIGRATQFHTPGSDGIKFFDMHRARTTKKLAPCAILPNVIEESQFHTREEYDSEEIRELRATRFDACETDRICLIPARLEPVKGLVPFFELLTPEMLEGWKIVVMGQGPLKDEVEALLKTRGIDGKVKILSYVPYGEMPKCYAAADLVLLPSVYDPNPLTCVEALHSGLPLALSCMAGNVEEAVTEGENGWVLPVLDEEPYRGKLAEVFATPIERLRAMGAVSKQVNARYWITSEAVTRFLDSIGLGIK